MASHFYGFGEKSSDSYSDNVNYRENDSWFKQQHEIYCVVRTLNGIERTSSEELSEYQVGENEFVVLFENYDEKRHQLLHVYREQKSFLEKQLFDLFSSRKISFCDEFEQNILKTQGRIKRNDLTPDFIFPDGIYINNKLCYWLELKSQAPKNPKILKKYYARFGFGCLLVENGLWRRMDFEECIVINGAYPFFCV